MDYSTNSNVSNCQRFMPNQSYVRLRLCSMVTSLLFGDQLNKYQLKLNVPNNSFFACWPGLSPALVYLDRHRDATCTQIGPLDQSGLPAFIKVLLPGQGYLEVIIVEYYTRQRRDLLIEELFATRSEIH